MTAPALDDVLREWAFKHPQSAESMSDLVVALRAREDAICVFFHLAGVQFGLFPQIVAEVLAEAGLGSPKTSEERLLIRQGYVTLMEQIAEQGGLAE